MLSVLTVRLLTQEDYGNISFALSIIAIASAFSGLGAYWSLLRFGPTLRSFSERHTIFIYTIKKGTIFTFGILTILIVFSFFLPKSINHSKIYLIILSFSLVTQFLYESYKSYLRIINRNRAYSYSNVVGSIFSFLFGVILSILFSGKGYAFSIVLAPLFSFLYFSKRIFIDSHNKSNILVAGYWSYGIYTGLGMIANQMIISLAPVIPGYLSASAKEIALLRVATIIPMNLLILPLIVLTTDFVHLSKNYKNANLLRNYYINFLKTFSMICFFPFLLLFVFNKQIIVILFGNAYEGCSYMSLILNISILFSFLFRIPLGNIIAAVGKANWNVVHTLFWIIVFIPTCIWVYPIWGVNGIASVIAGIFIVSGFFSILIFSYYLKMLKI